jgi:anti-sigma B factor antagonist
MAIEPRRQRLKIESIGDITVVNFLDRRILDEQNIQAIGEQLFSLVDDSKKRKVLLTSTTWSTCRVPHSASSSSCTRS